MPTHDYKKPLGDLLKSAESHEIVIPFFQRSFVWKKDQLQRLLASVLLRIPIGSFLFLKASRDYFKHRPIVTVSGQPRARSGLSSSFLLDGQQRLTSLHALLGKYDPLNSDIPQQLRLCWYLNLQILGLENLEKPDFGKIEIEELAEAVVGYPAEKLRENHALHPRNRGTERELQECLQKGEIPLYGVLDIFTREAGSFTQGRHCEILREIARSRERGLRARMSDREQRRLLGIGRRDCLGDAWENRRQDWVSCLLEVLVNGIRAEIPAIEVDHDSFHRAISIFEIVNKQGTPLHLFDLLLARAARDKGGRKTLLDVLTTTLDEGIRIAPFMRRHPWYAPPIWKGSMMGCEKGEVPQPVRGMYVNVLGLLCGKIQPSQTPAQFSPDSIRRNALLTLSPRSLNSVKEDAAKQLARALAFAQLRCGVPSFESIPYDWMIVAMAAVFSSRAFNSARCLDRMEYWYWSCALGGAFRDKQDKVGIAQANLLSGWVEAAHGTMPPALAQYAGQVLQCPNYSDFDSLKTYQPSGIYHALQQFVLSRQPQDLAVEQSALKAWDTGDVIEFEDHHIRPLAGEATLRASASKLRRDRTNPLNSVLNRTLISKSANRELRALSPDRYRQDIPWERFVTHLIPDHFLATNVRPQRCLLSRYQRIRDAAIQELATLRR